MLLLLVATCFCQVLYGQQTPTVRAAFTPDSVWIGDHFHLRVEVERDMMQVIEFPSFDNGMLGEGIEILQEGAVDTVRDGRKEILSREYTLTSFDAATYHMGQFPVLYIDKNVVDTLFTADSLLLFVQTFEIDTTTAQLYDIKAPIATPLRFGEFSLYLLWGVLALLVLGALIYLYLRYRARRREGAKPKDPPHVVAIKRLEALHHHKLWQSGKVKPYYTELTDIVREYLSGRYGFAAMELTSTEILERMEQEDLDKVNRKRLQELLFLADFVKFAKMLPEPQENESSYDSACYFVEDTKPQEPTEGVVELEPMEPMEVNEEPKNSDRNEQ